MGTKMAAAFMSVVETEILNLGKTEPLKWKRYIDDISHCGELRDLFIFDYKIQVEI